MAVGRAEDVAGGPLFILKLPCVPEVCVAGPQADGMCSWFSNQTQSDQTAGVVAGADDDIGLGIETVSCDQKGRHVADHFIFNKQGRQPLFKFRCRGLHGYRAPAAGLNVGQVRPEAVPGVDRCRAADQQRSHKRTDQGNVGGFLVACGIFFPEFSNLWCGKPFGCSRSGQPGHIEITAQRFGNFPAFFICAGIHPDRRRVSGKNIFQLNR